jgi:hypothetical protein
MPLSPDYITNRGIVTQAGKKTLQASAIIHDTFVNPANGATLTLSAKNSTTKILAERMDGAPAGVAGTITIGDGTTNGVYTPNTAPDGTHSYDVWYISDHPEESL